MQDPVTGTTHPLSAGTGVFHIHWGAAIAGALAASAVWLVLEAFGIGIGLAISSPAPSWRNASIALSLLSGIWMMLITILAYGVGGYVAGRLRTGSAAAASTEVEWRDGMQGLMAWAIAVLIGVVVTLAAVRTIAPAAAEREGGTSSSSASSGEPRFVSYEVDRLLRGDRRPEGAETARGEIGRLLMASLEARNFTPDDRGYLSRLVAARTGLAPADADRRVDAVVAQTREKANRARRSAVLVSFMTAASLLLAAVVAWFAAGVGGRHRDGDIAPFANWHMPIIGAR